MVKTLVLGGTNDIIAKFKFELSPIFFVLETIYYIHAYLYSMYN